MTGMPAITSSMLCNENCQKLMQIKGSVCEKCYTKKYLSSRPSVDICYRENSDLLSSSIIPKNQLPFVNAAYCRLETFGDIINATHLQNYVNLVKKNNHCINHHIKGVINHRLSHSSAFALACICCKERTAPICLTVRHVPAEKPSAIGASHCFG